MEYKGQLFGKVGKSSFPLIKTAEEVDKMEAVNKKMVEHLISAEMEIKAMYKRCNIGSSNILSSIQQLIEEATTV